MINNINPLKNPVTTVLGMLLLVIAIGMFIVPMFYEVKEQLNYWIPTGIGLLGICFLLIPDAVISALRALVAKKGGEL